MIVLTEAQKEVIESQGYTAIEFKKWWKDIEYIMGEISHGLYDIWRKIANFLECMAYRAHALAIKVLEPFEHCVEFIKAHDYVEEENEIHKYRFVKQIGNTKPCIVNKQVVYHRCRDRC